MQIFYCIAIFCELLADDLLLLVARSNHWPAPCLARCFWHNLYDCLLSITFSYCHLLLSQKPFWLNHNLLVSSRALLLIGACSSNNAQGTYICYVPFIDHICVLVVKLCIDNLTVYFNELICRWNLYVHTRIDLMQLCSEPRGDKFIYCILEAALYTSQFWPVQHQFRTFGTKSWLL
jgi:hypothetical protein